MKKIFEKKCPLCGKTQKYKNKVSFGRSVQYNKICQKCSIKSKERNLKISNSLKISYKNGTRVSSVRSEYIRKKISKTLKGNIPWNKGKNEVYTQETLNRMRLSAIKRIENQNGQCSPNYNPTACKIINDYGKKYGYNFQHAENGGEFFIKELGYWIDGYDKKKNIVIEYYEKHHNRQKEKDKRRKSEIIAFLKCNFIEICMENNKCTTL